MKKTAVTLGLLISILFVSCGPKQNEAIEYNDRIMGIFNRLSMAQNNFVQQLDGHNIDSLKLSHKIFSDLSDSSLVQINKIEPFAGKREFLDASLFYFKTLNGIAVNEAKQMTDLIALDSTGILNAENLIKFNISAESFDKKYDSAFDTIILAQKNFTKEWKFILEKTKGH